MSTEDERKIEWEEVSEQGRDLVFVIASCAIEGLLLDREFIKERIKKRNLLEDGSVIFQKLTELEILI